MGHHLFKAKSTLIFMKIILKTGEVMITVANGRIVSETTPDLDLEEEIINTGITTNGRSQITEDVGVADQESEEAQVIHNEIEVGLPDPVLENPLLSMEIIQP